MRSSDRQPTLRSYRVLDPLDRPSEGAVEVTVELADGSRRWCFFMTPERLALVGDYVGGTTVRMHLGERHMVVVADLTAEIIDRVLRELDVRGLLVEHTQPIEDHAE